MEATVVEPMAAETGRSRLPDLFHPVILAFVATIAAIAGPALLAQHGWGMSRQNAEVVFDTAVAALLSIIFSIAITRRVLLFPLLRTSTYVVLTFVGTFGLVAVGLKLFKINFSSPQFFIGMAMMAGFVEGYLSVQRRFRPLDVVVVPGGLPPARLSWTLTRPIRLRFLSAVPHAGIKCGSVVADLSCRLSSEWERFLAS